MAICFPVSHIWQSDKICHLLPIVILQRIFLQHILHNDLHVGHLFEMNRNNNKQLLHCLLADSADYQPEEEVRCPRELIPSTGDNLHYPPTSQAITVLIYIFATPSGDNAHSG